MKTQFIYLFKKKETKIKQTKQKQKIIQKVYDNLIKMIFNFISKLSFHLLFFKYRGQFTY